jgi:DNA-binding transcriptional LysR family regulator
VGIATTKWACRRELADGSLIRLFLEWKMADIPVHAYFPMGRATRAAGRALVECVVAKLADEERSP